MLLSSASFSSLYHMIFFNRSTTTWAIELEDSGVLDSNNYEKEE